MPRYHFLDHIFGNEEDEESDDAVSEDDEGNDESDDDESDNDEDNDDEADEDEVPEEDDEMLARLDKAFRSLRARVRASTDLSELRSIRSDQAGALAGRQTPTVRLRTLDIMEIIDDRVTDLRASRGGPRSH